MSQAPRFQVKDSGQRTQFDSGMVRDTTEGKIDYTLALDGPMFKRYAEHLTKGAQKYAKRNWMQASGREEYERFVESFLRHAMQWLEGDRSEDHAAAMWFNINGAEYTRERMLNEYRADSCPVPEGSKEFVAGAVMDLDSIPAHERWPDGAPT